MRAVVVEAYGVVPVVREVPRPEPVDGGVVLKVEATGLCRSDWHGWMGHDSDIVLPHVPGHEFAGTIAAVGAGVSGWAVGDRVTTPFICACGKCEQCLDGNQQVCPNQLQPGFNYWGSFAEYVAVPYAEVNLVRLPDDLDFATAAGLGCRFATSFRAVHQVARVTAGERVAVFGCGGVGLSAVMIASALGAEVIAIDTNPAALALARTYGATHTIQAPTQPTPTTPGPDPAATGPHPAPTGSDPAATGSDPAATGAYPAPTRPHSAATGPHPALAGDRSGSVVARLGELGRPQVTIDALGSGDIVQQALRSLRPRGRHVQVGLLPDGVQLDVSRLISQELTWLGSHGMPAHAYSEMLNLVATGNLNPHQLITRTIRLEEAPAALAALSNGTPAGVTVITP
ncbi:alcohol dehydrogenase [Kribbella aluminosa]|uniref:Alcohol dehydrogenase n=1 Tax=Kribbella aluminosa TaxID=416017 RepID=A0ABS4UU69_9ACTN|nr:alcohol dehydrogenase catalytic domain-containing protein [Kribbella aluminosa]MBP2355104.1 alcohol dehydrogenase [Kribbella aluminosa]